MENKKKILVIVGIIVLVFFLIYYVSTDNSNENTIENLISTQNEESDLEYIVTNDVQKKGEKEIAVHIVGEVKRQGIVYVEEGSRVADVIKKAGGETKESDLSKVNLAYIVKDGEKIYIPNKNEKIDEYITKNNGNTFIETNHSSTTSKEEKININTANLTELDSLPGIGPAIAQKIIDYREENGKFKKIEDLQNVKGIGDAKFEEVKDNITV